MTDLRRSLHGKGVGYRVVKNTLTHLAADAAGKPGMKEIVDGPTGIAFSFDDPVAPAKAIREFVRSSRSPMTVRGGLLGKQVLTATEVEQLADVPSKEELVARLMGQLLAPITGLAYVLDAPVASLARVLQRKIDTAANQEG
jgi:large subunit ribosomal protein L10